MSDTMVALDGLSVGDLSPEEIERIDHLDWFEAVGAAGRSSLNDPRPSVYVRRKDVAEILAAPTVSLLRQSHATMDEIPFSLHRISLEYGFYHA